MSSKIYNLFISHSWTYSNAYEGLLNLLNKDSDFLYKNYSVPKNDPLHTNGTDKQLYEAIKGQIAPSSIILMVSGVYASYSKWIDKEIKIAKSEFLYPKKIIAIQPWGAEKTSQVVNSNADAIVGWNSKPIIDAIKRLGG